jgi:hypothetical protein
MSDIELKASSGRISIGLKAERVGEGLLVMITGGKAHIGAVAAGTFTGGHATSSVITMPAHREDRIVKDAAEKLSKHLKYNTVVVAGVHFEDITPDEINVALKICDSLISELISKL